MANILPQDVSESPGRVSLRFSQRACPNVRILFERGDKSPLCCELARHALVLLHFLEGQRA
jgi:hypothetical protein